MPALSRGAREAVIALVALPVLVLVGFLLGSIVTGDDVTSGSDAAPAVDTLVDPTRAPAGPALPSTTPVATSTAVATPSAAGAPSATATPTQAATPSGSPTPAPTAAAPTAAPTTTAPAPAPTTAAPAAAPTATTSPAVPAEPTAPPSTGPPGTSAPGTSAPTRASVAPSTSPDFAGLALGVGGEDVRVWQQRMADRGWDIEVDGVYGPESERIATAFQAEKGLAVDGIVGPETWGATWTAPIT